MSSAPTLRSFSTALDRIKSKIKRRSDPSPFSMSEQLDFIEQLSQFSLGQVLLEKGSIDTFWTDHITNYSRETIATKTFPLEDFILNRSPFTLGWREVFNKFKEIIQANLKSNMILASIPCGAMREFLELDYSKVSNCTLIGIDIDLDSLSLARQLAGKIGLTQNLQLCREDAWQLPYNAEIDLISSCGLNIYEPDRDRVLDLYRQFYKALKPGGQLVIGFLTYPPGEAKSSEWSLDRIPNEDLLLESVLYKEILDSQWRNFRTSEEFENELKIAGFSEVVFHYDKLRVFPTAVAKKF